MKREIVCEKVKIMETREREEDGRVKDTIFSCRKKTSKELRKGSWEWETSTGPRMLLNNPAATSRFPVALPFSARIASHPFLSCRESLVVKIERNILPSFFGAHHAYNKDRFVGLGDFECCGCMLVKSNAVPRMSLCIFYAFCFTPLLFMHRVANFHD